MFKNENFQNKESCSVYNRTLAINFNDHDAVITQLCKIHQNH